MNEMIAVVAGEFDPVSEKHMRMMEALIKQKLADEIMLVPVKKPGLADDQMRMKMLQLALNSKKTDPDVWRKTFISDAAVTMPGEVTNLAQLMDALKAQRPNKRLMMVLDAETLLRLHEWEDAGRLVDENEFIVLLNRAVCSSDISEHFTMDQSDRLLMSIVSAPELPKTGEAELRQKLELGGSLAGLVSPSVEQFIKKNKLYRLNA